MNHMEVADIFWNIDELIAKNQEILRNTVELSKEEEQELISNRNKIEKLFKLIEDSYVE